MEDRERRNLFAWFFSVSYFSVIRVYLMPVRKTYSMLYIVEFHSQSALSVRERKEKTTKGIIESISS